MEKNGEDQFECPSCGTVVEEEEKNCSNCGAIFENGAEGPHVLGSEPPSISTPSDAWTQFPSPPQNGQNPELHPPLFGEDIPPVLDLDEGNNPPSSNSETKKLDLPSTSLWEFKGKMFDKQDRDITQSRQDDNEEIPKADMEENVEPQSGSGDEIMEEEHNINTSSEPGDEIMEDGSEMEEDQKPTPSEFTDEESAAGYEDESVEDSLEIEDDGQPPQNDTEEETADLPVSMQGLNQYKYDSSSYSFENQKNSQFENKVMGALKEYSDKRRKRYKMGTVFLGLGIVFFVLLWLVVVYDVMVIETQQWLGAHVVLILAAAGIFFTTGLYMILTYPKSSLIEVLAYLSESKQKRQSSKN